MPAVLRARATAAAAVLAVAFGGVALPATAASAATHRAPVGHVGSVSIGQRALAEAARHLGAPYVFGSAGPRTFDCSGLIQYAFAQVGVSLPRSSGDQYAAVRHIATADRQPGDLIFFRLGGGGVDHVGIYAGNNQIVVAPKSGDHVRYQTLWTSAYSVGRVG
ncbi:hypothetical protein acdb102_48260 [Acidothermaceae bacterium B102]|nr:hypothetical protein acdb102_48260 [Acidothermaceae bacterium B102]